MKRRPAHQVDLALGVDSALANCASNLNLDLAPALAARADAGGRLGRAGDNGRKPVDVAPVVERLEEQLEGGRQKREEDEDGAESGPPARVEVTGACERAMGEAVSARPRGRLRARARGRRTLPFGDAILVKELLKPKGKVRESPADLLQVLGGRAKDSRRIACGPPRGGGCRR
jgi:hypothetical protein